MTRSNPKAMLHTSSVDLGHLFRSVVRAHHLILARNFNVCAGCQRYIHTLKSANMKHKNVFLTLQLLPSPKCTFTSSPHNFWRQGVASLQTDLPPKPGQAPDGVSATGPSVQTMASTPAIDTAGDVTKVASSAGGATQGSPSTNTPGDASPPVQESTDKSKKILKVLPRPRKAKPLDYVYTGNIYILPVRAMNEFLLKPSDLEGLPKYSRRSPYDGEPKIIVFLRSDVEAVAKKVWGSLENISRERQKLLKMEQQKHHKYDIFQIRAILDQHKQISGVGDEKPYMFGEDAGKQEQMPSFWKSGTARVVLSAVLVNGLNSIVKFVAWLFTGSHSMFSEFVHSVADTMNQIILGFGIYHSIKKPDPDHPYGYSNLRNISSLISGVGIFFFGTGLSLYHGIQGFMHPEPLTSFTWGIASLVGAFVSEGATLLIAINQVKKSSRALGMSFWEFVQLGVDPSVTVVLLEDLAAVAGVGVAGVCMSLTQYYGSSIPDAIGSIIIGGILGTVASFIISANISALVGKSIPLPVKQTISQELEGDRMIRSLHDIKATYMGGSIRFKAEVDFDGREITRAYLCKVDLDMLLAEIKELQTVEDVEVFMMKHGERIVDMLGEEVDRIEKELKKKHPDLRHVDLEAL